MTKPQVSKNALRAMAALLGLALTDEGLEGLLPQAEQTLEGIAALDVLNLEGVEPALIFKADRE